MSRPASLLAPNARPHRAVQSSLLPRPTHRTHHLRPPAPLGVQGRGRRHPALGQAGALQHSGDRANRQGGPRATLQPSETLLADQRRRLHRLETQKQKLIEACLAEALAVADLKERQGAVANQIADAKRPITYSQEATVQLDERLNLVLALT